MGNFSPIQIIEFWFSDEMRKCWFSSTKTLDTQIKKQFQNLWQNASEGKLEEWKNTPEGCLALIIILDQLPLNMFRGEAKSFQTEASAINLTRHAINMGFDKELNAEQLAFFYMPLMHSENLEDQDDAVRLYEEAGLEGNLRFAKHHREIIHRFGRFPHRNKIIGRISTEDELAYLDSPQAFKG